MTIAMQQKEKALSDCVGNTPLVRLDRITGGKLNVYAKLELLNPGGSVKDRAARMMILDGIESGRLKPGMRIMDATSGNTGIAYAWIGASLGYGVTLCIPQNASPERFAILEAYGVELVRTSPLEGTDGAQQKARELVKEDPHRYFYPDQYSNPANWRAHFEATGPEIWRQTDGRVTHFVSVIGTCGTFVGTSRFLKEQNPKLRAIEVQPDSPFHGLEGIKHLPTCDVPKIYDETVRDELYEASTEKSQEMAHRLAHEEGILCGPSSGANVLAAVHAAEKSGPDAVVVTMITDDGARYLR